MKIGKVNGTQKTENYDNSWLTNQVICNRLSLERKMFEASLSGLSADGVKYIQDKTTMLENQSNDIETKRTWKSHAKKKKKVIDGRLSLYKNYQGYTSRSAQKILG